MPIYEYECDGCHEVFEVRQKISDPPPAGHACGSQAVHRVLSATTFVLKGTGWYKTDYADKPKPKAEGDAKADAAAPSKGTDKDAAAAQKPAPAKAVDGKASGDKAGGSRSRPADG